MYNWYPAEGVTADRLPEGTITEVLIHNRSVCLLKKGETIHAFAATCPHAGARFCNGWLDAVGRVVCPLHEYRFDPANGRNTSGEGYKLRTYPVELRENTIFVGLLES